MKQNRNNKKNNKKMVVFMTSFASEMGGIKDLLVLLGKKHEVKKIECEYQWRKFLGPWGLKELAELYRENSINKLSELSSYYCERNLLKGMKEFSLELKKRGVLVGALSSDPQFMMDIVKKNLELDFAHGTELKFEQGISTGNILKGLTRYKKAELISEKRKELGILEKNVICLGRAGITHIPAIKESGVFVGFDPKKENFWDIIQIVLTNRKLQELFFE